MQSQYPPNEEKHYFVEDSQAIPQLEIYTQAIREAQMRGEMRAGDANEIKNVLLCGILGVTLSLIGIPEYAWGNPDSLKEMTIGALILGLR
ncbi:hypothetical protein [Acinetobacter colistiniresistens]|uniref:hypothetical protein n=1 Tax=Acinetobacter colistiniresistens TaxID=280145 RepID=UPI001D182BBB|nr:hypothetical protein [Acinetobacter colistiniresistens]